MYVQQIGASSVQSLLEILFSLHGVPLVSKKVSPIKVTPFTRVATFRGSLSLGQHFVLSGLRPPLHIAHAISVFNLKPHYSIKAR